MFPEFELYRALTGKDVQNNARIKRPDPVLKSIDFTVQRTRDQIYGLVDDMRSQMEQGWEDYFGPAWKNVDHAYKSNKSKEFREAIEGLIRVIYQE